MHNRDLENTNHLTQTAWHDVQTDNRRLQQQVISVMDKQAALQSKLASAQNDARAAQTALQEKEEENATDAQALQSMLWERLEAWAGPEHMPYWCLLRQRLQELDMSFGKNPNGLLYMAVNDLIYYQEEFRALVNDAAAIAWKEFKVDIAKKKKLPHTNKYHALRKQVCCDAESVSDVESGGIPYKHPAGSLNAQSQKFFEQESKLAMNSYPLNTNRYRIPM